METKNLTTESSLKIIAETMERSRMTIAKNSGRPLILWGCLVAVTSVIIYFLWSKTGSPVWNLLWFAMSIIGFICTIFMSKNSEKAPKNEVSRILGKTWMWFGFFTTGLYLMIWVAYFIMRACNPEASIHVDLTLVISYLRSSHEDEVRCCLPGCRYCNFCSCSSGSKRSCTDIGIRNPWSLGACHPWCYPPEQG